MRFANSKTTHFASGFSNHEDYDRCATFMDISGSLGTKPAKWIEPHRICRMSPFSSWRWALFGEMIVTPSEPGDGEDKATTMYGVDYYDPCPDDPYSENRCRQHARQSDRDRHVQIGAEPGLQHCRTEPHPEPLSPHRHHGTVVRLVRIEQDCLPVDAIRRDDTAIGVTECQVREMPDLLKCI